MVRSHAAFVVASALSLASCASQRGASTPTSPAPAIAIAESPAPPPAAPRSAHLVSPERRNARLTLRAPATLAPGVSASVVPHSSGVAVRLLADRSAVVRRGDVLATVGPANNARGRREDVRAPIDGVVFERRVSLGDPIEGNRTVLFALGTVDPLLGRAEVPEADARMIRIGQPVELAVASMPDRIFQCSIRRVDVAATAAHTVAFEFDIPNMDHSLSPGQSATARVVVATHEDALMVPTDAIAHDGAEARVFTLEDHHARARRVTPGIVEGPMTEITDGLQPTDRILAAASGVHDGDEFADESPAP